MTAWKKAVAVGLLCGLVLGPIGRAGASDAGGRIDINSASAAELAKLPGIGPSKAQAIVEFREKEPFAKSEDLRKVKGIGDKLYDSIKDQVTVGDAPSPKGRGS
jgi:competence protein ComEA